MDKLSTVGVGFRASSSNLVASLSKDFTTQNISKIPLDLSHVLGNAYDGQPQPLAYLLENVLTQEECKNLITVAEDQGFDPGLISIGDSSYKIKSPDFRNNYETRIADPEFADVLWKRISPYIPSTLQERPVAGLSSDLRFLRYDPGQKFGPHRDGTKRTRNIGNGSWLGGNVSMITLQFYLNDGFEGGETSFLGWDNNEKRVDIIPKAGTVLVFEHFLLHQGSELKSGRKYSFITDVMYREVELEEKDESQLSQLLADISHPSRSFWNCSVL